GKGKASVKGKRIVPITEHPKPVARLLPLRTGVEPLLPLTDQLHVQPHGILVLPGEVVAAGLANKTGLEVDQAGGLAGANLQGVLVLLLSLLTANDFVDVLANEGPLDVIAE